jgi:hypothetical protein
MKTKDKQKKKRRMNRVGGGIKEESQEGEEGEYGERRKRQAGGCDQRAV